MQPELFISEREVALNAPTNKFSKGTTLNSDGEDDRWRRSVQTFTAAAPV
jgi:hypothetical protein